MSDMFKEIKEEMTARSKAWVNSMCASGDEVRICWLIAEVEALREKLTQLENTMYNVEWKTHLTEIPANCKAWVRTSDNVLDDEDWGIEELTISNGKVIHVKEIKKGRYANEPMLGWTCLDLIQWSSFDCTGQHPESYNEIHIIEDQFIDFSKCEAARSDVDEPFCGGPEGCEGMVYDANNPKCKKCLDEYDKIMEQSQKDLYNF